MGSRQVGLPERSLKATMLNGKVVLSRDLRILSAQEFEIMLKLANGIEEAARELTKEK